MMEDFKFFWLLRIWSFELRSLELFFILFRRFADFPQIERFEVVKTVDVKFGMSAVCHMLFGAIFASKLLFTINTHSFVDSISHKADKSFDIYTFFFEWRETMLFLEMFLSATMRAKWTNFIDFFFVDKFELRYWRRLAFVLVIKQFFSIIFVLKRIDMLFVCLWRHKLFRAHGAVYLTIALTLRWQFSLKF